MIRILVIDDEPRWIDFVQKQFGAFEIVIACSEEEAARRISENRFSLVIASARWLNALENMGNAYSQKYSDKTVVVTVKPSIDEALQAYNIGVLLYMPKSFNPRAFLAQIQEVMPART